MVVKIHGPVSLLRQVSTEESLKRAGMKALSSVILQTYFKSMIFPWNRKKNLQTFYSSPNNLLLKWHVGLCILLL